MEGSPHQTSMAKLPFSPNINSTPRAGVLGPRNINTGGNVKNSLSFNNSTVAGSLLGNLTLNDISGLINTSTAQQPSYLGMLLNDTINVQSASNHSGSGLNASGVSGINDTTQNQCQSHSNQQAAEVPPTEYSKPRIIKATARDISLTLPHVPTYEPTECPCKRPKSSTGSQYEDDPFIGRTYSKEECKTTGTEAFNRVSVSKSEQ